MNKVFLIITLAFLMVPSINFGAYGAKDLNLKFLCFASIADEQAKDKISMQNQASPPKYPVALSFKGKKAYLSTIVTNENEILKQRDQKFSYTVYVDKIALKQKGGNQRLSLDKNTYELTGEQGFIDRVCESKTEIEIKNLIDKILSRT